MNTNTPPVRERPAAYKWPLILSTLLIGHVVIVTGALVLSSTLIPAASVAPSGYAEALGWDDRQELRVASKRLGWSMTVEAEPPRIEGHRRCLFYLSDAQGKAVRDAEVRVSAYHHSRPDRVIDAEPGFDADAGAYVCDLVLRREGQWRAELLAIRGGDVFLVETDLWVGQGVRLMGGTLQ